MQNFINRRALWLGAAYYDLSHSDLCDRVTHWTNPWVGVTVPLMAFGDVVAWLSIN